MVDLSSSHTRHKMRSKSLLIHHFLLTVFPVFPCWWSFPSQEFRELRKFHSSGCTDFGSEWAHIARSLFFFSSFIYLFSLSRGSWMDGWVMIATMMNRFRAKSERIFLTLENDDEEDTKLCLHSSLSHLSILLPLLLFSLLSRAFPSFLLWVHFGKMERFMKSEKRKRGRRSSDSRHILPIISVLSRLRFYFIFPFYASLSQKAEQ